MTRVKMHWAERPIRPRSGALKQFVKGSIPTAASHFSTSPSGFCLFLAGYFSRHASQSMLTGLWRHFAGGSNFQESALFGSGYAGLGDITMKRVIPSRSYSGTAL